MLEELSVVVVIASVALLVVEAWHSKVVNELVGVVVTSLFVVDGVRDSVEEDVKEVVEELSEFGIVSGSTTLVMLLSIDVGVSEVLWKVLGAIVDGSP